MLLGLVLSGGGVRGAAHIGVLKALHEAGIRPGVISGTSAGSIVAGLYAYGYTPHEIGIIANRISNNYYDIDYPGILASLVGLFCRGNVYVSGLIKGDILESAFSHLTKGAKLKSAKIPVSITAVDINNTNIVIFASDNRRLWRREDFIYITESTFAEAIRASIAIPGIFRPKIINKMRLVDGGIRANLPVEVCRHMGAQKVIAVNLGYSGYPVPGVDNIIEISLQSIDIMVYQITKPSIDSADILIQPSINNVKHSDMSKIDYIIDCGYEATKLALPTIKGILMN